LLNLLALGNRAFILLILDFDTVDKPLEAHFIRAPGVTDLGEDVEVLARCDDKIIMIAKDRHLALSFHPELTQDTRIHQYWLQRFS